MNSSYQAVEELEVENAAGSRRLPLTGTGRAPTGERLIEWVLLGCALVTVLITIGFLATLAIETLSFLEDVPLSALLLDSVWAPLHPDARFGVWPLVGGAALTSLIALAFAMPCGLLSAIYLSELATPGLRRSLKPALELLAGVPGIVFGYIALILLTPFLQPLVPSLSSENALSPGMVIGLMVVPVIISMSEDALRAVPVGLREAAYALGATKLTTVFKVVLPLAARGVVASFLVALSRALGDTMVVAMAAGHQPRLTLDPRVPIEAMSAYILRIGMEDGRSGALAYHTIFVVGAALFSLTLILNVVSYRLVRWGGHR